MAAMSAMARAASLLRRLRREMRRRLCATRAAAADAATSARWRRMVLRAQRLAFKRRSWSALGELLRHIKAQGRRAD